LSKLKEVLKKPVSDMTSLEMWALFFRYVDNPECRGKLNDILSVKEAMGTATKLLTSISQDERERAIYRSRRMYQTDMESNLRTAELRGELRGKLQGELQGVIKVATNMKLKGKSIEEISDLTGLSTSEINDIEI
jgi:predicted transposase/invertase (TIGR01784 family)